MAAALRLRGDYDGVGLRRLARRSENAGQTRRLLSLAAIYDGVSRTEAARIGGVGLQTVRDWVLAFNAVGPAGLVDGKAPGNAPLLNTEQRRALIRSRPHGFVGEERQSLLECDGLLERYRRLLSILEFRQLEDGRGSGSAGPTVH